MDILIKYMEMPKSCEECPLFFEYYNPIEKKNIFHCRARGEGDSRFADDFDWHTKPTEEEGCPLVPVPEHGDLIDRDKEIDEWEQTRRILSECEQKHTFEYRKACVIITALSQAEVVLERTT